MHVQDVQDHAVQAKVTSALGGLELVVSAMLRSVVCRYIDYRETTDPSVVCARGCSFPVVILLGL